MSKKKRKNKTDVAALVGPETSEAQVQTSETTVAVTGEPSPADAGPQEPPLHLVVEAEEPQGSQAETQASPVDTPPVETSVAAIDDSPVDIEEPREAEAPPPATDDIVAETEIGEAAEAETSAPADEMSTSASDEPALRWRRCRGSSIEVGEGLGELSTERVVEAILFTSDSPLTLPKIVSIMGTGSAREVRKIIQGLNKDYAKAGNSFRIEEIAGGFQMLTMPEYNTWLRRLRQSRQDSKLSPAAMETLAVIAYKQPVVRAEIESIRGVSAGETLNRLRELGLVKIVGRAEDVGRPMLYGTTKHFLEVFGTFEPGGLAGRRGAAGPQVAISRSRTTRCRDPGAPFIPHVSRDCVLLSRGVLPMIKGMSDDPDYILDIQGIGGPSADQEEAADRAPGSRKWIGIKFDCCGTYARVYKNRDGTAYEGRCPRCLRSHRGRDRTGRDESAHVPGNVT